MNKYYRTFLGIVIIFISVILIIGFYIYEKTKTLEIQAEQMKVAPSANK